MQNQDNLEAEGKAESVISIQTPDFDNWENSWDDDIIQQESAFCVPEDEKISFIGDKENSSDSFYFFHTFGVFGDEPLSSLAAKYESGNPILLEKMKVLNDQFAAIRRTRGDGNCFFRSHVLISQSQDRAEVDRIKTNVENCRKTLRSLGYTEFTFEDFFALFLEQLESALRGNETSISLDELVLRSRDQSVSDYVVMFFRFVTSGEIQKRSEFFEPFIMGLTNGTVEQFCKSSVEPMGEESDHVHIIALSDALGVAIRVLYLDRSSCDSGGVSVNHHDFIPAARDAPSDSVSSDAKIPFITLLYRPGHYDILYPK